MAVNAALDANPTLHFERGEVVIQQGELGDCAYLLDEGALSFRDESSASWFCADVHEHHAPFLGSP